MWWKKYFVFLNNIYLVRFPKHFGASHSKKWGERGIYLTTRTVKFARMGKPGQMSRKCHSPRNGHLGKTTLCKYPTHCIFPYGMSYYKNCERNDFRQVEHYSIFWVATYTTDIQWLWRCTCCSASTSWTIAINMLDKFKYIVVTSAI